MAAAEERMNEPAAVLRWFERQVGRTVTLRDGRKLRLCIVDGCSGELSLCIEVPGSGLVWIGLDELKGRQHSPSRGAA
jgi:hypothetical protein